MSQCEFVLIEKVPVIHLTAAPYGERVSRLLQWIGEFEPAHPLNYVQDANCLETYRNYCRIN